MSYQVTLRGHELTEPRSGRRFTYVADTDDADEAVSLALRKAVEVHADLDDAADWTAWTLVSVAEITDPCRFCGAQVTSTNPAVDFCEMCFYSGRPFAEDRAELLRDISASVGVEATVWHTGGGCFAIGGNFGDGSYFMVTDGSFGVDGDGPWLVGFYRDDEDEGTFVEDVQTGYIGTAALRLRAKEQS